MNDQSDDALNWAGLVLAGVIALVLAGVVALAVSTARHHASAPAAAARPAAQPVVADEVARLRIDFAPGSTALPAAASQALVRIADQVRGDAGLSVGVAGATEPARAVRHALEANGLTADRIVIEPPEAGATGSVVVRSR